MSSHSQQIVYACDGVTSKHSSAASDKLRIALALWGSVDFVFLFLFFILFLDLNLSVDWIIHFSRCDALIKEDTCYFPFLVD